jgi:anti-sigma B factor antagonist
MTTEELPGKITKVILDGSLDINGAEAIELKMNQIGESSTKILVDLAKVSFIGSMGLRTLILTARAVTDRGGKMAIAAPSRMVRQILLTSGLETVVPIYDDIQAALDGLH